MHRTIRVAIETCRNEQGNGTRRVSTIFQDGSVNETMFHDEHGVVSDHWFDKDDTTSALFFGLDLHPFQAV